MQPQLSADPIPMIKHLPKEVRREIRKYTVRNDKERVAVAARIISAIRHWYKHHSVDLATGSDELVSLMDQATYGTRVVKKELGVSVTYVKKTHTWIVACGVESVVVYG